MGWNSDHMCDEGVQEVVDGLTKAFLTFVVDKVQRLDEAAVKNLVNAAIKGTGGIFSQDNQRDFRDAVQDAIIGNDCGQEISNALEPAFEQVVSAIDQQMNEVADEGERRISESGDYVYIEDVPSDQSEEVDELGYKVDELETEIEELKEKGTRTVHLYGHVEPFKWNEGCQLFVCPKTGQAYKLVKTNEICTSC